MNLILSHPDTAKSSGELHKVFKGGGRGDGLLRKVYKKSVYDTPIRCLCGDLFTRYRYKELSCKSKCGRKYIDFVLFVEKILANHESHNMYRKEGVRYSKRELLNTRLTAKHTMIC